MVALPMERRTITERLLDTVEDRLRQIGLLRSVERLAQRQLLDGTLAGITHLVLRVHGKGHVHKLLVQERHTGLNTPGRGRLVGTQTVILGKSMHLGHSLLVEFRRRRSLVKVQVAGHDFIRTLSTQYHLHTHGLDSSRKQVHRRRSTNSGHIIGFQMPDHVLESIDSLVDGEGELVMDGTQKVGNILSVGQIRRTYKETERRVMFVCLFVFSLLFVSYSCWLLLVK
mmetsp:Transcript_34413/g.86429  ORF Transcript_34413/g.86429 Transcript_34413/m.86429 type:complete len:227 (-) Transcript_34413:3-683(-)